MAIGIVSDSDFDSELSKGTKCPCPTQPLSSVININKGGRSEGDNNVPDSIRKVIVDEVVQNGRASALEIAKGFGISPSSVSAYTDGKTSTSAATRNDKLSSHLKKAKLNVALRAKSKLNAALANITDDKLGDCKAVELAQIAKAMSGVIKDMEPPSNDSANGATFNGPSIVLYNPGFTKESKFETVEANE